MKNELKSHLRSKKKEKEIFDKIKSGKRLNKNIHSNTYMAYIYTQQQ